MSSPSNNNNKLTPNSPNVLTDGHETIVNKELDLEQASHLDNEDSISKETLKQGSKRQKVGSLELLEERAVVDKERLDIGKVTVRKQIKTKTVNIPIELVEEVLVIETDYYDANSRRFLNTESREEDLVRLIEPTLNSKPSLTINGSEVFLDEEPVEVVLSRQVAVVKKETHAVQDVSIEKSTHIHKDTFDVELKHEELDINEEGNFNRQTSATNDNS